MKFTFKRTMVDYCEIEAATLEEAETLVYSGRIDWPDDKWACEIDIVGPKMNSTQTSAPTAPLCPAYLEEFHWTDGDVTLECFVDYFAPDESIGYAGGAQLCHAYHAGVDLLCYLDDGIIEMIERRACSQLSGY